MVNGEDICHLDVQCGLDTGEEIVEFINVELLLGFGDIND